MRSARGSARTSRRNRDGCALAGLPQCSTSDDSETKCETKAQARPKQLSLRGRYLSIARCSEMFGLGNAVFRPWLLPAHPSSARLQKLPCRNTMVGCYLSTGIITCYVISTFIRGRNAAVLGLVLNSAGGHCQYQRRCDDRRANPLEQIGAAHGTIEFTHVYTCVIA